MFLTMLIGLLSLSSCSSSSSSNNNNTTQEVNETTECDETNQELVDGQCVEKTDPDPTCEEQGLVTDENGECVEKTDPNPTCEEQGLVADENGQCVEKTDPNPTCEEQGLVIDENGQCVEKTDPDESNITIPRKSMYLSGIAIDGYLNNAEVYIQFSEDVNLSQIPENLQSCGLADYNLAKCKIDTTNSDGSFNFSFETEYDLPENFGFAKVVSSENTIDTATGETFEGALETALIGSDLEENKSTQSVVLTPLTTVATSFVKNGSSKDEAFEKTANATGVSSAFLQKDPITELENGNGDDAVKVIKQSLQIQKTAEAIAQTTGDFTSTFSGVANLIEANQTFDNALISGELATEVENILNPQSEATEKSIKNINFISNKLSATLSTTKSVVKLIADIDNSGLRNGGQKSLRKVSKAVEVVSGKLKKRVKKISEATSVDEVASAEAEAKKVAQATIILGGLDKLSENFEDDGFDASDFGDSIFSDEMVDGQAEIYSNLVETLGELGDVDLEDLILASIKEVNANGTSLSNAIKAIVPEDLKSKIDELAENLAEIEDARKIVIEDFEGSIEEQIPLNITLTANPTTGDTETEFTFSATANIEGTTFEWDTGETGNSITKNFEAGTHTITVTAKNGEKVATDSVIITVSEIPEEPVALTAYITASRTSATTGSTVSFYASSNKDETIYQWFVNGSVAGNGSSFSKTFTTAGTYSIKVVATNGEETVTAYKYVSITNPVVVTPDTDPEPTEAIVGIKNSEVTVGSGEREKTITISNGTFDAIKYAPFSVGASYKEVLQLSFGIESGSDSIFESANTKSGLTVAVKIKDSERAIIAVFGNVSLNLDSDGVFSITVPDGEAISGYGKKSDGTELSSSSILNSVENIFTESNGIISIDFAQALDKISSGVGFANDVMDRYFTQNGEYTVSVYISGLDEVINAKTFSTTELSNGFSTYTSLIEDKFSGTIYGFEGNVEVSGNFAPEINSFSVNPDSGRDFDTYSIEIDATDTEGDTLTYSYSSSIDGTIANPDNFSLSIGSHTITASVSDGVNTVTEVVTVVVTSNSNPVISSFTVSPTSGNTTTEFVFSTTATDTDGDTLTKSYSSSIDGNINETTTLSEGTHTITVTVTDGNGGSATQTLTITVSAVAGSNNNPTISSFVTSATSGETNTTFTLTTTATDSDGDTLSYSYSSDIDGAISDETSFTLSEGTHTITVIVTDGNGGSATQTLTITVSAVAGSNNNPTISSFVTSATSGETNTTFTLTTTATDSDGDTLSYSYSSDIDGAISDETSFTLSEGTHTITVIVTDGNGGSATQTLTITVSSASSGAVSPIGDTTISVTSQGENKATASVTATNAIGSEVSINFDAVTGDDASGLTFYASVGGSVIVKIDYDSRYDGETLYITYNGTTYQTTFQEAPNYSAPISID
jgi:PKD repeat protein/3-deoxy-D-manno-octulosonate 8-phosphate phosphatase KdsC-like HAD superfamily phosphatase